MTDRDDDLLQREYARCWFGQHLGFTPEETDLLTGRMRAAIVRAVTEASAAAHAALIRKLTGDDGDGGAAGVRQPVNPRPDPVTPGAGFAVRTYDATPTVLTMTVTVDGRTITPGLIRSG